MSALQVQIRVKPRSEARWRSIAEVAVESERTMTAPTATVAEDDEVRLQFAQPIQCPVAIRVYVGNVLVASTIATDRVLTIKDDGSTDSDSPPLVCNGEVFADWMGITELTVHLRRVDSAPWHKALVVPVAITPGKLAIADFDRLFAELERDASEVLLDIYGKTQLGLKTSGARAPNAPIAILRRVSNTICALDAALRRIHKRPHQKFKVTRGRELGLIGQAVSDATLEEACSDPSMLCPVRGGIVVREHLSEHTRPDYRISEHQAIADFGETLKAQLADLRTRINSETTERQERKRWRSFPKVDGGPTWWEQEDLPRIEELAVCQDEVAYLRRHVDGWASLPYLPQGTPLRTRPQCTPLFRNHPAYRKAYEVIEEHFGVFETTLDSQTLLIRARSLPKLYEWWCAVRIVRFLASHLTPLAHDPLNQPLIATRLKQGRKFFTIEFLADQAMTFEDCTGARVRFRYEPRYVGGSAPQTPVVALLDGGQQRTPDIALEVYPARSALPDVPNLIVVFDSKYSSVSQRKKLGEVQEKYSKIGDRTTGRVLSRQVWALTPKPPVASPIDPMLETHCTVDNQAFWSEQFHMDNPVNGAVQARPVVHGQFDPLEGLLTLLLRRAGIQLFDCPAQMKH